MPEIKDLFSAKATTTFETATLFDYDTGLVVPEYQRQYNWDRSNISRLYHSILEGFGRIAVSAPDGRQGKAYTFLGTLILVKERINEEEFSGTSVAIIDGQQRLTTLILFACAIFEELRRLRQEVLSSPKCALETQRWIQEEIEEQLINLTECFNGSQKGPNRTFYPFPRIIRQGDIRGKNKTSSAYRSAIAKFLDAFAEYQNSTEVEFLIPITDETKESKSIITNYKYIRDDLIRNLSNEEWYEESETSILESKHFSRSGTRALFKKFSSMVDEKNRNKVIDDLAYNDTETHNLIRCILFASYFCDFIVLTTVVTEDEDAAFDIFDSLNTTGEPLTALETLKPKAIRNEPTYEGSASEVAFKSIEQHLDEKFLDTSKRQNETKDLICCFALYLEGRKLSRDLAAQRAFIRQGYDTAFNKGSLSTAQLYTSALAKIAQFRSFYWDKDQIDELSRFHSPNTVEDAKLCASFIKAMNTHLALPILLRYWTPHLKQEGDQDFIEVLKAVTAFLVLRRAATGNTAGIDADLRSIMVKSGGGSPSAERKFGLCAGSELGNELLNVPILKEALRTLLKYKLKTLDRHSWVNTVAEVPLYQFSQPLVRFMILAAAHQALPDEKSSGLWTKEGVKKSSDTNNFLNYTKWASDSYRTIEHIAPTSRPTTGWDQAIYKNNIMKDCLGNLTLLPDSENSAIGNNDWQKKKLFYLALTEEKEVETHKRIEEARKAGIRFSKNTEQLLKNGEYYQLLSPLRGVEEWDPNIISERGKNIAGLCWDQVWPWLQ